MDQQHFKTYEWLYCFKEISDKFQEKNIQVDSNFFTEYHGKSLCDSHFSLISRYYKSKTTHKQFTKAIHTTKDYIELLQHAILKTNQFIINKNQIMKDKRKCNSLLD